MPEVKKNEHHKTITTVVFDASEVMAILGRAALDAGSGRSPPDLNKLSAPGRSVDVKMVQLEEGSPGYKVDKWRAFVTVTENHLAATMAEPDR